MLCIGWLFTRFVYSGWRQLVPDEAYYWVWSRHLATGYFDHPPMAAYFIRLGTLIAGNTSLGVRWPAAILTLGIVLILGFVARRLITDRRAVAFVVVALLFSPFIVVLGTIMTPDTPACFFQTAALAVAVLMFAPNIQVNKGKTAPLVSPRYGWLMFGALMGLALASKYTSGLLGLSVLLALVSHGEGRSRLQTPWPWLGALISLAVFSPVIFWNAQHDWASFRFQFKHGLGTGDSSALSNVAQYLGGQLAVCTPVLFVLCMIVLVIFWRRRSSPMHDRVLLLAGTVPLLFFGFSSLQKRVEANWPVFAYLPIILLIGEYLSESWTSRRAIGAEIAVKTALVCTFAIHFPEAAGGIDRNLKLSKMDELFGWRELAGFVQELRRPSSVAEDWPIFTTNYQYASELSFYLPGHPLVWPLPDPARPTVFDFLPGRPALESIHGAVLVRRQPEGPSLQPDPRLQHYLPNDLPLIFQSAYLHHTLRWNMIDVATP